MGCELYRQMRENFWIPEKIDVTQDVTDYANLTSAERHAFDGILSYLTFLDSVQTWNVPHIKSTITAPEISLCLAEQISQEAMHNQSYQYIIETVIPSDRLLESMSFGGLIKFSNNDVNLLLGFIKAMWIIRR